MNDIRRPVVLIADDADTARERLVAMVRRASPTARIVEAVDGYEALRESERVHPDLAILDHVMPHITGLDVARILRTRGVHCEVVTSSPISDEVRRCSTPKDDIPAKLLGWLADLRPVSVPRVQAEEQCRSASVGRVLAPA